MNATQIERRPRVGGVVEFSTLDYPGRLSTVVFVQGCPWQCTYCHNPHLQPRGNAGADWSRVRALLQRRAGLVDAVVFSGGEPTADPALEDAIREARAMGFAIGLHTAGIYPRRLEQVLPLVDWVGLDVKAPFDHYGAVTGVIASGEQARESVRAVLASGCDYEMRTTFDPEALTEFDVRVVAHSLADRGVRNFALQEFRAAGCADASPRMRTASLALRAELAAMFPHFVYRAA
jgi:pyruvate formate lyase activating enzyme